MDDSFFGFDTSLPLDDDVSGEQIAEPPEEEYDALNDETFGSAINGDWEEVHENLVRLTGDLEGCVDTLDSGKPSVHPVITEVVTLRGKTEKLQKLNRDTHDTHCDLSSLSTMKTDDLTYGGETLDNFGFHNLLGNSVKLDLNVWSTHPIEKDGENLNLVVSGMNKVDMGSGMTVNPPYILCQNVVTHVQKQSQHITYYQQNNEKATRGQTPTPQNFCTLEDIERNLILQQAMLKQQDQEQQKSQHSKTIEIVAKFKNSTENLSNNCKTSPVMLQPLYQQQKRSQTLGLSSITKKELTNSPLQQQQQQPTQLQLKNIPKIGKVSQQSPIKTPVNHSTDNLTQQTQQQHHNLPLQQQQYYSYSQMTQHTQSAPYRPPSGVTFVHPSLSTRYCQFGPPPQIPPHPLLNQHSFLQRNLPNSHLPIALNNFAMHPNFNSIRAAAASTPANNNTGIHPAVFLATQQQQSSRMMGHLPMPLNQMNILNHQAAPVNTSSNVNGNMFNMRLMQEIQQNHPLLQNVQRPPHPTSINSPPVLVPILKQHSYPRQNILFMNHKKVNHNGRMDSSTSNSNGNLPPEEFDEYSNLMSTRDKHWLIGIQLSQLNTDTPYIDDYYYTVYRERKGVQSSNAHSQAHKDNQLNHPLIQPKGHAQLILVQLGNKNGSRNGQLRERRNSDNYYGGGNMNSTVQDIKLPSYIFTPMKFENSLGKLQYGSVTAPRKIIDADIMTTDVDTNTTKKVLESNHLSKQEGNVLNVEIDKVPQIIDSTKENNSSSLNKISLTINSIATSNELNAVNGQRKSRYILLHIESLYRIILKLDDLNNPTAIATILTKKKKEQERIAALELLESSNKTVEERVADVGSNSCLKSKFTYDIEAKETLIGRLISGLQHDKIVAMMNVRKGKVLIKRILRYIEECDIRWTVWISIFSSLENVFKKDRDDAEGLLYALYTEFKKQIKCANFQTIVKISSAIILDDKKANGLFCTKFGMFSLVCLILQAEHVFLQKDDETLTYENKENWRNFLDNVASALNHTIENQTICAAIEINSIQPMIDHFARFKDLKLESLLALFIEAKQQLG